MIVLYLVLLYFILFFIYHISTKKYINPYRTYLYIGKKGSGKTTLLTKIAIKAIKKGKVVYSTVEIPGTRLIKFEDLAEYKFEFGSIVLLDEVGIPFDNRNFKNFDKDLNIHFKYFRQYGITCHMFSQAADIDLKIRNLCDAYYLVENKFRVFSVCKRISKILTVGQDIEGKGKLVDSYEFVPFFVFGSRIFTYIPRWTAFYNSYDPPIRKEIPYIQLKMNDLQKLSMKNHKLYKLKVLFNSIKKNIKLGKFRNVK